MTTIIDFEGSSCQLHKVVINLITVKNYKGFEILPYLQPSKLTATTLWMLREDKTPGSKMKARLLHRTMAVSRVSAFLWCLATIPMWLCEVDQMIATQAAVGLW